MKKGAGIYKRADRCALAFTAPSLIYCETDEKQKKRFLHACGYNLKRRIQNDGVHQ